MKKQSLLKFPKASSSSASPPPPARASSGAGLRQASIFDMASVVDYRDRDGSLEGVGSTLFLGRDDVNACKRLLEEAHDDRNATLKVLRRISAMPCLSLRTHCPASLLSGGGGGD